MRQQLLGNKAKMKEFAQRKQHAYKRIENCE